MNMKSISKKIIIITAISSLLLSIACHSSSEQPTPIGSATTNGPTSDTITIQAPSTGGIPDGGVDGGGGDPLKSTKELVRAELKELRNTYFSVFSRFKAATSTDFDKTKELYALNINDPKVDNALRRMLSTRPVLWKPGMSLTEAESLAVATEPTGQLDLDFNSKHVEVTKVLKKIKFEIKEVG